MLSMQRKILPIWLLNDPFLKTWRFEFSKYCKKKPLNLVLQTISLDRTVHSLKGLEVHIISIMTQRYIFKRSSHNLVAKKVEIFTKFFEIPIFNSIT